MTQRITPLSLLAIAGALSACGPSNDPVYTQFYREAGAVIDSGDFGSATARNQQYMTNPEQWARDLSERFAKDVLTTVTFAFNSARLDAAAQDTLRQQAHWIRQFPEARFRVYGHTDAVGSNRYNQRLGLRRAKAAVNYLVSQGISRSRLEAVASFGERQPLIVTQGRERRNRRTVTEVSGFVENHPMLLDGKYAEVIYREYIKSAVPKTNLSGGESSGEQAPTSSKG